MATKPAADWFGQAEEQLCAIERLAAGWDSNRAEPIDPQAVRGTLDLLGSLCRLCALPRPHINPTRRGGVQLEWESGPRSFEIEVVAEGRATYFFQDEAASVEEEGEIAEGQSLDTIREYVRQVTGR